MFIRSLYLFWMEYFWLYYLEKQPVKNTGLMMIFSRDNDLFIMKEISSFKFIYLEYYSKVEIPLAVPECCEFGAYLVSAFFITFAVLDFLAMIKVIHT